MKSTIIKTTIFAFVIIGISSCSTNNKETNKTGKAYTSTYVCPMHCEGSGAEKAGQCPVCGMDYVLNNETK